MKRVIAIVVLASAVSGCGYNTMVELKEKLDAAWAQVENQLQRRNDLIPNLVNVAKGYAAHEKEVFEAIAEARSKMLAAGTRGGQIDAANQMTGALGRVLALGERYPDLKANEQFNRLSYELAGTENRIAVERKRYNEVVQEYNTYVRRLPQAVYASIFGFSPEKYFEAGDAAKQVPKVEF